MVITTVRNTKISGLVKKTDYEAKISKIEKKRLERCHNNKYVTTQQFNRLTAKSFTTRLKEANLVTKTDIFDFVRKDKF